MLYTLALILIIAWLLGLVSSYTMGGFIHVLLVVALVVVLVRVIQGKRINHNVRQPRGNLLRNSGASFTPIINQRTLHET